MIWQVSFELPEQLGDANQANLLHGGRHRMRDALYICDSVAIHIESLWSDETGNLPPKSVEGRGLRLP